MFAYPGGSGPRGLWGFGQGDYTPTDDFREIWWDPNRISAQNNKAGAWVQLNGGRRWSPRQPADRTRGLLPGGLTVAISTNGAVATTNGTTPAPSLESLRTQPENVHLFRGYGPLVVGIILFVLMVTLAPTVAPGARRRAARQRHRPPKRRRDRARPSSGSGDASRAVQAVLGARRRVQHPLLGARAARCPR